MSDFISALLETIAQHGFPIDTNQINWQSTAIQRFKNIKRPKQKDLFLRIHHDFLGANFGDWHDQSQWVVWRWKQNKPLSIVDRQDNDHQRLLYEQRKSRERSHAIKRLTILWNEYCHEIDIDNPNIPIHNYIRQKRIRPLYARSCRSVIVLPVRDIDYDLVSLQFIKVDGFKRFKHHAQFKDAMVWLSEPLPEGYSGDIRICEGWATGCTIYDAIGAPVVCAMSAGNLVSVATQLRKKYPHAWLKICADNDQWGSDNVGIHYAVEAAKATNATIYWPEFNGLDCSKKPTDFNDLQCLAGIEAVENQLLFLRKQ